jgi:hypothetical protein
MPWLSYFFPSVVTVLTPLITSLFFVQALAKFVRLARAQWPDGDAQRADVVVRCLLLVFVLLLPCRHLIADCSSFAFSRVASFRAH